MAEYEVEDALEQELLRLFPNGLDGHGEEVGPMFEVFVEAVSRTAERKGAEWTVDVELADAHSSDNETVVRGLIVQTHQTCVVPVEITRNVIRLKGKPTYIKGKNATSALLRAVLAFVSDAIDEKPKDGRRWPLVKW